MNARQNILNRLRQGCFENSVTEEGLSPLPVSAAGMAEFEQHMEANNAEIRHCQPDDIVATVLAWYEEIGSPLFWISPQTLTGQDLYAAKPEKAEWVDLTDPAGDDRDRLFNQIGLSLTHCDAAIAETGTLVLIPSKLEPRSMSLVPPAHMVIMRASQLVPDMPSWMSALQSQHLATNIVCISGPSKTADIQQTLAYGAHGPAQLFLIIVDDLGE